MEFELEVTAMKANLQGGMVKIENVFVPAKFYDELMKIVVSYKEKKYQVQGNRTDGYYIIVEWEWDSAPSTSSIGGLSWATN